MNFNNKLVLSLLLFISPLVTRAENIETQFRSSFVRAYEFSRVHAPDLFSLLEEHRLLGVMMAANIEVTDEKVLIQVNGVEQESVAANNPGRGSIRINRQRWNAIGDDHLFEALSIHEVAGLKGLESQSSYPISSSYLALFGLQPQIPGLPGSGGVPPFKKNDPDYLWLEAIQKNDLRTLRQFIADGYDVNKVVGGAPALAWASLLGQLDLLEILLAANADPNRHLDKGNSPLELVVTQGSLYIDVLKRPYRPVDLVRPLLKAGARVNVVDKDGATPLMWAACYGMADIVDLLLESGANPHIRDKNKQSAYDYAVIGGQKEIAKRLKASLARSK